MGLPPQLERIIVKEDREMRPYQEERELVDLGIGSGKKEVKIGTGCCRTSIKTLVCLFP